MTKAISSCILQIEKFLNKKICKVEARITYGFQRILDIGRESIRMIIGHQINNVGPFHLPSLVIHTFCAMWKTAPFNRRLCSDEYASPKFQTGCAILTRSESMDYRFFA
jgi:hypothetical protein